MAKVKIKRANIKRLVVADSGSSVQLDAAAKDIAALVDLFNTPVECHIVTRQMDINDEIDKQENPKNWEFDKSGDGEEEEDDE